MSQPTRTENQALPGISERSRMVQQEEEIRKEPKQGAGQNSKDPSSEKTLSSEVQSPHPVVTTPVPADEAMPQLPQPPVKVEKPQPAGAEFVELILQQMTTGRTSAMINETPIASPTPSKLHVPPVPHSPPSRPGPIQPLPTLPVEPDQALKPVQLQSDQASQQVELQPQKSQPSAKPSERDANPTEKHMECSGVPPVSDDSRPDVLDEPAVEGELDTLKKDVVYLKKSESSHRHEQRLLHNALEIDVTDTRLQNECEDLRAEKTIAALERDNVEKRCALLKIQITRLSEELQNVRDQTAKSLAKQKEEMTVAIAKSREATTALRAKSHEEMAALRAKSREEASAARTELVKLKAKLERCEKDLGKSEAQVKKEKRIAAGKIADVRKEERQRTKEAVSTAEEEHKGVEKGHLKTIAALEKGKADAVAKAKKEAGAAAELRKELQKVRRSMDRMTKDVQKKQSSLEGLERRLEKETTKAKDAAGERDELMKDCKRLEKEVKAQSTKTAKASSAAEEATEKLRKLEEITKDFTLPPAHLALVSPAPQLRRGKRRAPHAAEDVASESRSRFTDNLPEALRDIENEDEAERDEDTKAVLPSAKSKAPRTKRPKRTRSNVEEKDSDIQSTEKPSAHPTVSLGEGVKESERKTKRRRKGLNAAAQAPDTDAASKPTKSKLPDAESDEIEPAPAVSTRSTRRGLRSRKPVSYDYDKDGRDIVNPAPGFEVDKEALRRKPATRSRGMLGQPPTENPSTGAGDIGKFASEACATKRKAPTVKRRGRVTKNVLQTPQRQRTRGMSAALTPRTRSTRKSTVRQY